VELKNIVKRLKKRSTPTDVKNLIKELCKSQPLKLSDLAAILRRHPKHLREKYLNDMVKEQELEHIYEDPSHPQQAYRTKK
jgi:ATP-dependent DNA helicase RecG